MTNKELLKYIQLYTGCNDHTLKRIQALLEEERPTQIEVVEKVVLVNKFVRNNVRPITRLQDWSLDYFRSNKTSYEDIAKRSRKLEVVRLRTAYCREAYASGYGVAEIGRYLKRDHTTIIHNVHHNKN